MSNDKKNTKDLSPEIKKLLKHHEEASEHPVYSAPGCGLASYSCLLLLFFLVGVGGLTVSSLALVQGQLVDKSYYVKPGHQVQPRRLKAMWNAKVITIEDVPILYHDESNDGSTACALMQDSIVRVDEDKAWKIPYDKLIDGVSERDGRKTIIRAITNDEEQLPCYFDQSEGEAIFLTELRAQIVNSKQENKDSGD